MPVKKLAIYPEAHLKNKIENSELSTELLKDNIRDLVDTLRHHEGATFITANQIDAKNRVAVIDLRAVYQGFNQDFNFKDDERYLVLVNPEILERSKEKIDLAESSLSTPNFSTVNYRSVNCKIKFNRIILNKDTPTVTADTTPETIESTTETSSEVQEETEVKVINQKDAFDNFTFKDEEVIFWDNLSYVAQAAVDQLDGKCYLDLVSYYNKSRFLKMKQKMINNFKKMFKQQLQQVNGNGRRRKRVS